MYNSYGPEKLHWTKLQIKYSDQQSQNGTDSFDEVENKIMESKSNHAPVRQKL